MLLSIVFLLIGFILLVKGADYFVSGSSSVARRLRIPPVVIGLTIVAMGTSLPEASVSITAAFAGSNEIALSNVIGSNTFNTLVVLGASAFIRPFPIDRDILRRDQPVNTAVTVLLLALVLDGMLGRIDGLILLACMIVYLFVVVRAALQERDNMVDDRAPQPLPLSVFLIILGIAAIVFGGDLVVDAACNIARVVGLSETVIGLTIVAIGTSLPELVTSVVAARKGESELALGNVVGSNLFNILFILGSSSALSPIGVLTENIIDLGILLAVTLALLVICRVLPRLGKKLGASGILLYVGYTVYLLMR
ncbi:MAG: calcium/sodium antiporter [Butyricicoccus sp.]|nr:calcium/sodium antiporter [Butyricicoccus sp.]